MGFSKMMELLQEKNRGEIVLCNNGGFYVATGKDAVFLNELLKLKVSCFKPEVCKIGFPIASLEKYTELIHEKDYGYIVYYFHKDTAELEKILEYKGKNHNEITSFNINCYKCRHTTRYYKKPDIYIQAVAKLYDKELEDNRKIKKKEEKYKWFKRRKKKIN